VVERRRCVRHRRRELAASLGQHEAGVQGTKEFLHELDDGFSTTVALCTGTARFGLGRSGRRAQGRPHRRHRCPVMVIATPLGGEAMLTLARPAHEQVAGLGGPLISCKR